MFRSPLLSNPVCPKRFPHGRLVKGAGFTQGDDQVTTCEGELSLEFAALARPSKD